MDFLVHCKIKYFMSIRKLKMFLIVLLLSCSTKVTINAPMKVGVVTSNLGGRWGKFHYGVDIGVSQGTLVNPIAKGTVTSIKKNHPIFGNRVDIYHPELGLFSSYSHLKAIYIKESQEVDCQDSLGLSGNTGKSTGPHLHLEVYNRNNVFIQPLSIIKNHNFTFKKNK